MQAEDGVEHRDDLFAELPYNESNDVALATLQNSLVQLSAMADSKANIMITVCSILLTLAISRIEQGVLLIPLAIFSVCCVPALIFAILTVMPSPASRTKPVGRQGRTDAFNPLFFMHFTEVPLAQFSEEMDRMIRNPGELYRHLSRDIYEAGLVLRVKKYRYLRWSYLALLAGVILAGSALLVDLFLV